MRYHSLLPLSAILSICIMSLLITLDIVPTGMLMLEQLKMAFEDHIYVLILIIILAESIVYVGFYFPGQFFAVLLVVLAKPEWTDILSLTLCMVLGATLGSVINYFLGQRFAQTAHPADEEMKEGTRSMNREGGEQQPRARTSYSLKYLLIAMIHINSLAFYMFKQGEQNRAFKIVWFAGLLNLPYYLLLIFATSTLSEQVLQLAENTSILLAILSIWLLLCLYLDYRNYQQ
ncbi:hypothetical protein [Paraglaciecola mesophila]|nr:hypothetical protein [Paraglaciecola mesophila]